MRKKVPSNTKSGQNVPNTKENQLPQLPKSRINAIPIATLFEWRKKGLTYSQIGKQVGCSKSNVIQRLHYHGLADNSIRHFIDNRGDVFAWIQSRLLFSLTDADIKKMQARDRIVSAGILYDKERLERGQSTGNISVIIGHIEMLQRGGSGTIQSNSNTIDTKQGNTDVIDITDGT